MSDYAAIEKEARVFTEECVTNNRVDPTLFAPVSYTHLTLPTKA